MPRPRPNCSAPFPAHFLVLGGLFTSSDMFNHRSRSNIFAKSTQASSDVLSDRSKKLPITARLMTMLNIDCSGEVRDADAKHQNLISKRCVSASTFLLPTA